MRISGDIKVYNEKDFYEYIEKNNFKQYVAQGCESIWLSATATVLRVKHIDGAYITSIASENAVNRPRNYAKYFSTFSGTERICRAVATLFLPQPPDDGEFYEVVYLDDNKRNDVASNLMWQPRRERLRIQAEKQRVKRAMNEQKTAEKPRLKLNLVSTGAHKAKQNFEKLYTTNDNDVVWSK